MRCRLCKNYFYHSPTWQDPAYDEYCKIFGDFELECDKFILSKYGKTILKLERIKKLERILWKI